MNNLTEPNNVDITDSKVSILWTDGHNSTYPNKFLRIHCQCAECIDEWSREARLDPDTVPNDVKALDHMPIGKYAIQFLWSDAHYTGIYTFEFLRSVCQCINCKKNDAR